MDISLVLSIALSAAYLTGYYFGSRAGQRHVIDELLKRADEIRQQNKIDELRPK